jgi:hypothetical protein
VMASMDEDMSHLVGSKPTMLRELNLPEGFSLTGMLYITIFL